MADFGERRRALCCGALLAAIIPALTAGLSGVAASGVASSGVSTRPAPAPRAASTVKPISSPYLSPVALCVSGDGKTLFISEATAQRVAVFDLAQNKVLRHIALGGEGAGLALARDGKRLFVAVAAPQGEIAVIDTAAGKITARLRAGHTPTAVIAAPDGDTLYVCNRFDNAVGIVSLKKQSEIARVATVREPVAAALTPNGKTLFVANHLPAGAANGDSIAAAVSVIDTARRTASTIALPNGSTSVRGICLSPDGRYAYVTHLLSHYQVPTTQVERGWMNTNAVTILDVAARKVFNTFLLDDVDLGAANPWGVACSADGRWLCVAQSGTHELSIIDRNALHDKLARLERGEKVPGTATTPAEVADDLAFLGDLRRRIALPGNGPRGLALSGTRAYVAEYFSDSLAQVNLESGAALALSLGKPAAPDAVRRGEMVFHDGNGCFQKWQSCASCHPDGRADGLNWDLLNDGLGNPKNTRNMLFSHRMPSAMSLGVRESAAVAVRAGFKFIQFSERPESDYEAVDAYLKSLRPVPSPHLVNGSQSATARRGKAVFIKVGCSWCHAGPLFSNGQKFDIGTGAGLDKGKAFVTPALRELWRTAPYLHDGRAATLREVVTKFNPQNRHGHTKNLTSQEVAELIAYLESL